MAARFFIKGSGGRVSAETKDYLLNERIIVLEGEITQERSQEIVRQLIVLDSMRKDRIVLLIDSPGGSVQGGLAIIDAIGFIRSEVVTVCTCSAFSMAAVIFSFGKQRLMFPHSSVMIHQFTVNAVVNGGSKSISDFSDKLHNMKVMLDEMLASRTGKTSEEIAEAISTDNFMDTQQAISFGIADRVIESIEEIMEVPV